MLQFWQMEPQLHGLIQVLGVTAPQSEIGSRLADGGMVTWGCRTMQISDKGSTAGAAAAAACLAFASWSGPNFGCDSSRVQHLLLNVVNGKQIKQNCVTRRACAVILGDGNVVTHGDPSFGGDSPRVQDLLRNVQQIYATPCFCCNFGRWNSGDLG